MPVSKAQQKAVSKYMKANYDELKVRVPKGKREVIKTAAEKQGKSVNGFVNEAIDEKLQSSSPETGEASEDGEDGEDGEDEEENQ